MTTKIWNNTNGNFEDATKWSTASVPTTGDTAVIQSGVVTDNTILPAGLRVNVASTGTTRPILVLNNGAGLSRGTLVSLQDAQFTTVLGTAGLTLNAGAIGFFGGGVGS